MTFVTDRGITVPAITTEQMREVDRIAVEEFQLSLLQMMENAGRNLALNVMDMLDSRVGRVTVVAGGGGNGGGGLCCARHLHNRGYEVAVILDRPTAQLQGAAATQWQILKSAGITVTPLEDAQTTIKEADITVDAIIGYSLKGAPRGNAAMLIDLCNQNAKQILSLDVPSGMDATNGETPGSNIQSERTLTLAAPKTGLARLKSDLYVADIGIPSEVFKQIGVYFKWEFGSDYYVRLKQQA